MRKEAAYCCPTRANAEKLAGKQHDNQAVPGAPRETGTTDYGKWTTADEKR